jgi:glycosyltransferase involved in cell wall biosynthesis
MAVARADLHLHSCHSVRSREWFFRRVGLPDSYSRPADLYQQLRARGMDFVTITDHDTIRGCLEIADRPGTFISEQLTVHFPEDRVPVHLLVWGLNEAQHAELQRLHENIYEVQRYLALEHLAHAVAHPLYPANGHLATVHLEKLALLFQHFEALNAHRAGLLNEVIQFMLQRLSPAKIEEFANRHGIAPTHAQPWKKFVTAGSDDHGGVFPGAAFTATDACATPAEFLALVRAGECGACGANGTPLSLSHGLYNNLRAFAATKFSAADASSLIGKAFSRFMEGQDPTEFSWSEKIGFIAQGIATGKIFELAKPANVSLWRQFAAHFAQTDVKTLLARETEGIEEPERRAFVIANFFANQLAFRFFTEFVRQLSSRNIIGAVQQVSTLLPILGVLAPYVYAFRSQAPDRAWLGEVSRSFAGEIPCALRNRKRAWFTDTLEDVNGVANTIRRLTAACVSEGHDLVVVTSRAEIHIDDIPIKNFAPIGEFELPEYELQKLSFPPILQILDYIERERFTELIISTPGPIGITALIAAKVLGLRTSGIYHTDFPQYVRILTDDSFLETLTWNYMKWFYDELDLVYVNSESYRAAWIERGIAAEKFRVLPRGLDTALFHPARRDPAYWQQHGVARDQTVLLYVGRISKEKDLDVIVTAWRKLRQTGCALAFVGDGPHLAELRTLVPDAVFTGALAGLELARAFASADVFLFPSTTDTFGNVVLEALASGLPVIVSDRGGPKDLIAHGVTGFITRALDADDFGSATARLLGDLALRKTMSIAAHAAVQNRDWKEAGRTFWAMSPE